MFVSFLFCSGGTKAVPATKPRGARRGGGARKKPTTL